MEYKDRKEYEEAVRAYRELTEALMDALIKAVKLLPEDQRAKADEDIIVPMIKKFL